jgi:hypothetical protein
MNATTIGVGLAKNRFELAVADAPHRVQRRERLSRRHFNASSATSQPAASSPNRAVQRSLGAHAVPAPAASR